MRFMRTVALVGMCLGAQASVAADQGFYFGLNAGQAKYDFAYEVPRVPSSLSVPATGAIAINPSLTGPYPPNFCCATAVVFAAVRAFWLPGTDDEGTAWGGFVGYRIFPYAAMELAYADLGSLREHQPERILTPTIRTPAVTSELETSGPALSALAIVPIIERWDVYSARRHVFADQKSLAFAGYEERTTYGSDAVLFGAGAQFDFGSALDSETRLPTLRQRRRREWYRRGRHRCVVVGSVV